MSRVNFEVDGKKYSVLEVSEAVRREAVKVQSEAWIKAVNEGMLLNSQVQAILKSRGVLDEEVAQKERDTLQKELRDLEVKLRSGRFGYRRMTKEEGYEIAKQMRKTRDKMNSVNRQANSMLSRTAESVADLEQLAYCVYKSTVMADSGAPCWPSFAACKDDSGSKVYQEAFSNLMSMFLKVERDFEKHLYENKWMIRMGYMNEKLQLLDDKGRLVDDDGRLINEDGRFVNDKGELIDIYGYPVDAEGSLNVEDAWADPTEPVKTESTTMVVVDEEIAKSI